MKRTFLFLAMLLMGVLTFAEETITVSTNSEDISQNLDLKLVAKLFAESKTTEQFEVTLNNPDSAYSNLDLNGDNQIDYLRVVEAGSGKSRLIVIQAVLAKDIYQDIASIYVEKDQQDQVSVQIIGDEYIYGTNYIIEPVYIYRPAIYDWLWSGRWYSWYSPWYWGYWPRWWYYRPCNSYRWYLSRCYRFHHHHNHYCSFRHGHNLHSNYHTMRSGVTRRDHATAHPDHSFNHRNSGYRNAGDLHRSGVTHRGSNKHSGDRRTFNNRGPEQHRTESAQKPHDSNHSISVRSTNSDKQHHSGHSGATRTHQTNRADNSNRSENSVHQKPNNGQLHSSQSYRGSSSTNSHSRGTSSNSSYRSSGGQYSSSRSSSSGHYCGGRNSSGHSGSSRSSGGGRHSSHRR